MRDIHTYIHAYACLHVHAQVFDPIVEDEIPEVARADEFRRLITLYGILIRAVQQAAANIATAADPTTQALAFMRDRISEEPGLIPASFDWEANLRLSHRRILRQTKGGGKGGGGGGGDEESLKGADEELEAEMNLVGEIVGEIVGAEWYVHVLCARLDGVPSARWKPDAEGSLVFEESYVFSGDVYSGGQPQPLGISMPPLTCLPAEGAEESEARQVGMYACTYAYSPSPYIHTCPRRGRCAGRSARISFVTTSSRRSLVCERASTTCFRC